MDDLGWQLFETCVSLKTGKIETKKPKLFQEFFFIIKNKKFARIFSRLTRSHIRSSRKENISGQIQWMWRFSRKMNIPIGLFAKKNFSIYRISCFTRLCLFIILLSCFHFVRNHEIFSIWSWNYFGKSRNTKQCSCIKIESLSQPDRLLNLLFVFGSHSGAWVSIIYFKNFWKVFGAVCGHLPLQLSKNGKWCGWWSRSWSPHQDQIISQVGKKQRQNIFSVLRIRIRDPVPFWPLDPGWIKNQDPDPGSESGTNNPDHISDTGSLETIFWVKILEFSDSDPGSGIENIRIWDPGWKIFGSGIRDKLPDPQHCLLSLIGVGSWSGSVSGFDSDSGAEMVAKKRKNMNGYIL